MTAYQVVQAFEQQIARHCAVKTTISPLAIREAGILVKIVPRKVIINSTMPALEVRLSLVIENRVDSELALATLLGACQTIGQYALTCTRLEDDTGAIVANSRIRITTDAEDALYEDPETESILWAREEYQVTINVPADKKQGKEEEE